MSVYVRDVSSTSLNFGKDRLYDNFSNCHY